MKYYSKILKEDLLYADAEFAADIYYDNNKVGISKKGQKGFYYFNNKNKLCLLSNNGEIIENIDIDLHLDRTKDWRIVKITEECFENICRCTTEEEKNDNKVFIIKQGVLLPLKYKKCSGRNYYLDDNEMGRKIIQVSQFYKFYEHIKGVEYMVGSDPSKLTKKWNDAISKKIKESKIQQKRYNDYLLVKKKKEILC